jgi:hypothetical protein
VTVQLRGGATTSDPRLDRLPQFDDRSRGYGILQALQPEQVAAPRSYTWPLHERLDQGREGACVEYGFSGDLLARPAPVPLATVQAVTEQHLIYWGAQRLDQWAGGSYPGATPFYEGTSVLAGAKVTTTLGFYGSYRWAFSLDELVLAVGHAGPVVVGWNWYSGMFDTDSDGYVHRTGTLEGGHCVCINSVDIRRRRFGFANSWGTTWGARDRSGLRGYAYLSFDDVQTLMHEQGEQCVPQQRRVVKLGT